MAYTIIDRTQNGKRSSGNRQKFLKRVKTQVQERIKDAIASGSITDLVSGEGKKINIPKKDLGQPTFNHGQGGKREQVHPGNDKYHAGDREPRPQSGQGQGGREGSKDGEGQDEFEFTLTQNEFLDIFFEDCELPDLENNTIAQTTQFENKRAGFSVDGNPAQLNIERTMRQSKGRRIGLMRKGKKKKLKELQLEEASLAINIADLESQGQAIPQDMTDRREQVLKEIKVLKRKLRAIPFVDDCDLRYNRWEKIPVPTTQAVMFCIMDVSASMGQWEKEMAKRFFMLLYLFLNRSYERVDIIFIRHHTVASEVDEDTFFHDRETGGTVVSTALELMTEIIEDRYSPEEWNIYASQASDGDNWSDDTHLAMDMLTNKLLPILRYYAYIELAENPNRRSDLWPKYEGLAEQHKNFRMEKVSDASDIYPVFKDLFKKS
jgi:uncharacterized sporulation protein YeaH/YhbH (DUF444 family)